MPHYRYTATSVSGSRVEGTAEAESWKDIELGLSARGYRLTGIAEIAANQIAAQRPAPRPAAPPARPATQASPASPSVPSNSAQPAAAPVVGVRKTSQAKDKELFFLFSQIASYLRAGVNPAQAFGNLAQHGSSARFQPALAACADAAAQGRSVADVLALYPYLFPPHIVGLYRAGEIGGFLPDACDAIAEQAQQSHKFKIWYVWLGICVLSFLASWPVMAWGLRALLAFWDKSASSSGVMQDSFGEMRNTFGEQFLAMLPWMLGTAALLLAFHFAWFSMPNRALRHRLALGSPSARKRIRAESIGLFSWTLSHLFRAGMAPKAAVELAADTMPNLELASRMRSAAGRMRAETKLSEAVDQVSMLDPHLRGIVATGEYVGDLPGALGNVASIQQEEFRAATQMGKARIGCWMLLVVMVGSVILFAVFYRLFYDGIYQRIFAE